MNQNTLNGIGGVIRNVTIKLIQLIPLYILVFILWGDRFLPQPLNQLSYKTRNSFNKVLIGAFKLDKLQNNKYNNQKSDRLIEEIERNQ